MSLFSRTFWRDAAERSVKTFAQSALATLGLGATNVLAVDWIGVLSVGAGAALISVLTSVASTPREGTLSPASAARPALPG